LSRAVERGFNPEWLDVGDKLIKFCLEYAIDPDTGGMIYEITDYEGQPLEGNPDNAFYIYWAQAETARALLHYTVVRGRNYGTEFKAVEILFNQYLTDQKYGGLYPTLDGETLEPAGFFIYKGDIWKTNYHYSMFFTEVLRLGEYYPDHLAELNTQVTPS
jgi:mannose/cellobiose epimerase-like protein (N-acyl-D-glucosamine 2-epimerase family)